MAHCDKIQNDKLWVEGCPIVALSVLMCDAAVRCALPMQAAWTEMEAYSEATDPEEPLEGSEPAPPPSYGDFEAALAATGPSKKQAQKQRISLKLADSPRRPKPPALVPAPPVELKARPTPKPLSTPPEVKTKPETPKLAPPPSAAARQVAPAPSAAGKVGTPVPPPAVRDPAPKPTARPNPPENEASAASVASGKDRVPSVGAAAAVPSSNGKQPAKPEALAPKAAGGGSAPQPPAMRQSSSPAPPPSLSLPTKPSKPTFNGGPRIGAEERRARSIKAALAALSAGTDLEAQVWQTNSAGVLVQAGDICGFAPLQKLSETVVKEVALKQKQLVADGAAQDGPSARSAALKTMLGRTLVLRVADVDATSARVIFSDGAKLRPLSTRPSAPMSDAALRAAEAMVGSVVDCRIRSVREFGAFVDFMLDTYTDSGEEAQEMVFGLVHVSEVAWDVGLASDGRPTNPLKDLRTGQRTRAKIVHVDFAKGRVFLSIRRATPNPLLETLDSLLACTLPGSTPAPPSTGLALGSPRQTTDASTDLRPILGDLEVAVEFVEHLRAAEGVESASLGVRLESRASSQDVEVYLAKAKDDGQRAEEAAVSGDGGLVEYKLVLRKGKDVQEVEVVCALAREEVRQLAAATVRRLTEDRAPLR